MNFLKTAITVFLLFVLCVSIATASDREAGYKNGYNDGSNEGKNRATIDNAAYGHTNVFSPAPDVDPQSQSREYRRGYKTGYREGYYNGYRQCRYINV